MKLSSFNSTSTSSYSFSLVVVELIIVHQHATGECPDEVRWLPKGVKLGHAVAPRPVKDMQLHLYAEEEETMDKPPGALSRESEPSDADISISPAFPSSCRFSNNSTMVKDAFL